jgi:hypothetical protein
MATELPSYVPNTNSIVPDNIWELYGNDKTVPLAKLMETFQGMDAWDAMKLQWKTNPLGTTMGLVGGIGQLGNSIWNAFQDYKTSKKMLNLEQDKYNLQKQMYEANEARNKERFNWLRQARSTSQL